MNITLIQLNIHFLLNTEIIPGCKLLHMMLQPWYLNMKLTFPVAGYEKTNFSVLSVT